MSNKIKEFQARVSETIAEHGTMAKAAVDSGLHVNTIRNMKERDLKRLPIDGNIKKLADACGVTFEWLKNGSGPKKSRVDISYLDNDVYSTEEVMQAAAFLKKWENELGVSLREDKVGEVLLGLLRDKRNHDQGKPTMSQENVVMLFRAAS